jgi:hypothetical protein
LRQEIEIASPPKFLSPSILRSDSRSPSAGAPDAVVDGVAELLDRL